MERFESLSNTLSQLTMYDIKSMYNQAKNVVLNVSETEAKVREATNDEPWGASSTLMQEIAQGTFNFQQFNEIMPCIYGRFMEKEARQWRQIYKALQLLEYLIKHGSERVVDDARSHISTLKMLRNFHYIDEKGKDEGINVRNRAKELVEMLSDVEKIRTERRKAKANKNKYIGVGNDGGYGGDGLSFSSGGGRYGGFGSDSLGGGSSSYSNDYYGGGGSSRTGGFSDSNGRRGGFEEYNAGDDEIGSGSVNRSSSVRTATRKGSSNTTSTSSSAAAQPAPAPPPVQNLLDFDDDDFGPATAAPTVTAPALATNKALPAVASPAQLDDDDFADFQVAPTTQATAPVAAIPTQGKANLMQLLNATPISPTPGAGFGQAQQAQPTGAGFGGMGKGMGMGGGMHRSSGSYGGQSQNLFGGSTGNTPMGMSMGMRQNATSPLGGQQQQQQQAQKKAASGFDDLWNLGLASTGKASGSGSGTSASATGGKSIKDLEKEKASAGLWGGQQQQQQKAKAPPAATMGGFGDFGGSSGGGNDDLLL